MMTLTLDTTFSPDGVAVDYITRLDGTIRFKDHRGHYSRKLADVLCPTCGATFRPKETSTRYCSRPCQWAGRPRPPQPEIPAWYRNQAGYIVARIRVDGRNVGIKHHRWVMERMLGRALEPDEDVHHINGIKDDNRPENLEVVKHGVHSSHHTRGVARTKGRRLNLTDEQRAARSQRMKAMRVAGGPRIPTLAEATTCQ